MNQQKPHCDEPQKRKQVVIVAMSGNMLLNFAGPADVFINANNALIAHGHPPGYDVLIASPTANRKVKTVSGMEIHCEAAAMEVKGPIDTLIIAGNDFSEAAIEACRDFYDWLAKVNEGNTRRIASICGGAFSLAKAGLLNGRRATTHWDLSERLKKTYPQVHVDSNAFFMNDGPIYTSGGVSSGIDLALAMVEEDHGKDVAIMVARKLVFYLSRPGFQSQFGNLLPAYESSNIAEKLHDWFNQHLHEPLDIERIAGHVNMSTRNFTRVFHKQTGISPAKFVEKLRVETARKYLEDTDIALERIADLCGLGNLVSMRRTFLRHLMTTPSDYRRAFRTSLKDFGIEELLRGNSMVN